MLLVASCLGCGTADTHAPAEPFDAGQVLNNGAFEHGLQGWKAIGDADRFFVFADPDDGGRMTVSTFTRIGVPQGDAATGTLSQSLVAPNDALALRFVVHGGGAEVKLLEADEVLYKTHGPGSNDVRVPVSWDLAPYRGRLLRLVIDDPLKAPWGYISVSGFDVIRERPNAVAQPEQEFTVPVDATALRFVVLQGSGQVRLYHGDAVADEVAGPGADGAELPVSWDLHSLRGEAVRIAIEDEGGDAPPIGVSAFDVITSANGP